MQYYQMKSRRSSMVRWRFSDLWCFWIPFPMIMERHVWTTPRRKVPDELMFKFDRWSD